MVRRASVITNEMSEIERFVEAASQLFASVNCTGAVSDHLAALGSFLARERGMSHFELIELRRHWEARGASTAAAIVGSDGGVKRKRKAEHECVIAKRHAGPLFQSDVAELASIFAKFMPLHSWALTPASLSLRTQIEKLLSLSFSRLVLTEHSVCVAAALTRRDGRWAPTAASLRTCAYLDAFLAHDTPLSYRDFAQIVSRVIDLAGDVLPSRAFVFKLRLGLLVCRRGRYADDEWYALVASMSNRCYDLATLAKAAYRLSMHRRLLGLYLDGGMCEPTDIITEADFEDYCYGAQWATELIEGGFEWSTKVY